MEQEKAKSTWQCGRSGSESVESVCFWASRIGIRIYTSEVWIRIRIQIRILLSSNKYRKKNLDSMILFEFISLKNDVKVPSKSNKQKNFNLFFLLASWRSMTKTVGSRSGSISQMHGSADPDPHQNVDLPTGALFCPPHSPFRQRYLSSHSLNLSSISVSGETLPTLYKFGTGSTKAKKCESLERTWCSVTDPGWKKIQRQDPRSGMNIPDRIFKTFVTVFWDKNPGSGMEKIWSGINITDPQHCEIL